MSKESLYTVYFEGWVVVPANSEDEATDLANELLSKSELPVDGIKGEWELSDVEITEEDF